MVSSAIAVGVTYTNHAPLLPLIAAELGLSDVQSGLLTTSLFLTSVVTFLIGGTIADTVGPRPVLAAGLFFTLAGNVLVAVGPTYAALLVAKGVTGLGSGLAFNSGTSYIAGLYGEARSHFGLGLYGAGYPLGSALAILTMPALALLTDWHGAFWLSSGLIALVLALWATAPSTAGARPAGTMLEAFRCGNCWWTSLQHAAGFGLVVAAGTWITVYLLREFGLPLELSGLLGSLLLLIAVVARSLGGLIMSRERLGSRATMRISQLIVLGGLAALAIPGRPIALALAGTVAVGLGGGLPYAAVFNTAAASLRSAPGAAQGLAAVGGTTGTLVGAPAMGYAIQSWGFSLAWMLLGAISALALLGTLLMRGEEDLAR